MVGQWRSRRERRMMDGVGIGDVIKKNRKEDVEGFKVEYRISIGWERWSSKVAT